MALELSFNNIDVSNSPTILSIFCRIKSKNIIRLYQLQRKNYIINVDTNERIKVEDICALKNTITEHTKIIFVFLRGGLQLLNTLRDIYINHKILFFTLDFPAVYAMHVRWRRRPTIKNIFHNNLFSIEVYYDKENIFKYMNTYFKNLNRDHVFNFCSFPNRLFTNYTDINSTPINKILLTGETIKQNYPERYKFGEYCNNNPDMCKIQSERYPHQEYAEYMRSYLAIYAGPVNWIDGWTKKGYTEYNDLYITTKIFEIAGVGSLLVVDDQCEKELHALGFINNVNCIYINRDRFDETVKYVVDPSNRAIIDDIRQKGQNHVKTYHTEDIFREKFVEMINKIASA
jgi:hypothetical protein